ncbi:MAG: ATPase [Gammaproteobacteria bacterium]
MALRPFPARWFEALLARDDLTVALEALARTGSVQLESAVALTGTSETSPDLEARLGHYHALERRYHPYWPREPIRPSAVTGRPARTIDRALKQLGTWEQAMGPTIERLEQAQAEHTDLQRLRDLFASMPGEQLDIGALHAAGPTIGYAAYLLPPNAKPPAMPPYVLPWWIEGPHHLFLLAVGLTAALPQIEQEMSAVQGRQLPVPPWLTGHRPAALRSLESRLQALDTELTQLRAAIVRSQDDYHLHEVLGDVARLEWFLAQVRYFPASENLAWVRGWTSDPDGEGLQQAIHSSGARALVHLVDTPGDAMPPMVLRNPPWARAFELFPRLLGVPAGYETDPSQLLALVAPLLFGYMFGDVGQGLVLVAAGLMLQRRFAVMRLLVVAGASAMVFGVLYGSVFAREDIVPALWLHPLAHPIPILAFPLAGGVVLLVAGMLLNGLQAHWRGTARQWWYLEAPKIPLYLGLLASLFSAYAALVAAAALLWYLYGAYRLHTGNPGARIGIALGELVEHLFQLAVNTLSFARVGAFALAHAGLSEAVGGLAQVAGGMVGGVLVYILGNIAIIALEGLVVSIQTTRLILFEFFIRFLHGEGRPFQPLPAPCYETDREPRSPT